jgi:hypothetical protein
MKNRLELLKEELISEIRLAVVMVAENERAPQPFDESAERAIIECVTYKRATRSQLGLNPARHILCPRRRAILAAAEYCGWNEAYSELGEHSDLFNEMEQIRWRPATLAYDATKYVMPRLEQLARMREAIVACRVAATGMANGSMSFDEAKQKLMEVLLPGGCRALEEKCAWPYDWPGPL